MIEAFIYSLPHCSLARGCSWGHYLLKQTTSGSPSGLRQSSIRLTAFARRQVGQLFSIPSGIIKPVKWLTEGWEVWGQMGTGRRNVLKRGTIL